MNISEGKGALPYQEVRGLLYFLWFFFSPTGIFRVRNQRKSQNYMKYFQALALEVFILDTNRPLDMDEPCHVGKFIYAIHSRVTLLFRSFPVFNSQHFNVSMQDAILLKISTDIWLEFALPICFYEGHMSS